MIARELAICRRLLSHDYEKVRRCGKAEVIWEISVNLGNLGYYDFREIYYRSYRAASGCEFRREEHGHC